MIKKVAIRRPLKEAAVVFGKEDVKKLTELVKLAKEIGLTTVNDLLKFLKNEVNSGESIYGALKRYRDELGDDFAIKVEECYAKLGECSSKKIRVLKEKKCDLHESGVGSWYQNDDGTYDDGIVRKYVPADKVAEIIDNNFIFEEDEDPHDIVVEYLPDGKVCHVFYTDADGIEGDYQPDLDDEQWAEIEATLTEGCCGKKALKEDKYYISDDDKADDFTRITHYLACAGYSETDSTEAQDEIAVALANGDEKLAQAEARKQARSLGNLATTSEGYITVTSTAEDKLAKAKEIASDFDCPIEEERTSKSRDGKVRYTIVINPYCGYEYGTPECDAAIAKWTPANQKVYDKKKKKVDVDDDLDGLDDDIDEAVEPAKPEETPAKEPDKNQPTDGAEEDVPEDDEQVRCEECGRLTPKKNLKEEIDLGFICPACVRRHRRLGESITFITKKVK